MPSSQLLMSSATRKELGIAQFPVAWSFAKTTKLMSHVATLRVAWLESSQPRRKLRMSILLGSIHVFDASEADLYLYRRATRQEQRVAWSSLLRKGTLGGCHSKFWMHAKLILI